MLGLANLASKGMAFVGGLFANVGLKPIRSFIDSHFREKVTPVAGSVVYCDLWLGAEHSGIYVADGQISNIVVTGFADSQVKWSDADDFTSKSTMGKKIYVSCDKHGAVGDNHVANGASNHVGEQSFYGLVFKNCHQFSSKCLQYSKRQPSIWERAKNRFFSLADLEWEATIRQLKYDARNKIGATKWRLWDFDNSANQEPEPDWNAQNDFFKNQPLTPEFIRALRLELDDMQDYIDEISDENIPDDIQQKLKVFVGTLQKVSDKYEEMKEFLAIVGSGFSYEQLEKLSSQTDFQHLVQEMKKNPAILDLIKKMGKNYISEEKKRQIKVPKASKDEVYGTHNSDDLMRLLPSELVNIDDDDLEYLFYAKLLEKNLLTYQLSGVTHAIIEENYSEDKAITGPIVACVDTSGSMSGKPLLKAKALLFAIANILKDENRHLYVLLFGASGQLAEFKMTDNKNLTDLLVFLNGGFNGGTDFETPLQRAMDIIQAEKDYEKADILMISDGDCTLSQNFIQKLNQQKQILDLSIYSVLCHGQRQSDNFSDEVVVL